MSLMDTLFGELPKNYCIYFLAISMFTLFTLVVLLVSSLTLFFMSGGKHRMISYAMFGTLVLYGAMYLQNRMMYHMCKNSM